VTFDLIGLVGRKRSGKDTVASMLNARGGYQRLAFADALKAVALELDPILWHSMIHHVPVRLSEKVRRVGWEEAKEDQEVRRILQALGVAVRTHIDTDAWVNIVEAKVHEHQRDGVPTVITDVRFPNEVEMIEARGGLVIRVTRAGLPQDDLHISETALDDHPVDYTVANDGSLEDLARQVLVLLAKIKREENL